MASRSRGNSVLASVRGFLDKDTASKQKVEALNEPGGFVHFYGKNKDKSKQVYIRIEPTGIRYVERPKDEANPNPDELKKALSDAPLHLYTAWAKFQMDSINDIVSIWVSVPKTAAADDSDKKKKKKKKDEATPASPSGETTQQELYFRVRRTLEMKQKIYSHMEELKKKMGGPSIRDRSASVAVHGPPRPQFKKEEAPKQEEPKPAAEESKKPKREKREFNRKKKGDDEPEEAPKKADEVVDTPKSKSESSDVIADSEKKTKKDKKKKATAEEGEAAAAEPLPNNDEKKEPEAAAEPEKHDDAGEEPKKRKKKAKKSAEDDE
eukprot:TRINITY_DN6866_c0_g1_i1.p1 TRINITY_DN6866_c0_g1~~TRINITY_DN6866_c0_g1_i1.p1  ORF type:complete len:323 (+),score=131.92 TRINITY_DN6866_c0_g1_i1:78-1046(+)